MAMGLAGLFSCTCCCANEATEDSSQIAVGGPPDADEGRSGKQIFVPKSEEKFGRPGTGTGAHDLTPGTSPSPPSTTRSLTPEEKRKEKERLQEMVKEFAKQVVQGQPCQWLLIRSADATEDGLHPPRNAVYGIDKYLKTFRVKTQDQAPAGDLELDMTSIEDVVKDAQATSLEPCRLKARIWGIQDFEKRFVCVQYFSSQGAGRTAELGLLMPNTYERERFFTCMKILRWAMDSRRSADGQQ